MKIYIYLSHERNKEIYFFAEQKLQSILIHRNSFSIFSEFACGDICSISGYCHVFPYRLTDNQIKKIRKIKFVI